MLRIDNIVLLLGILGGTVMAMIKRKKSQKDILEIFKSTEADRVGYFVLSLDVMNPDENPVGVDIILDFLSQCEVLAKVDLPQTKAIRYFVRSDALPHVHVARQGVPYYEISFHRNGTYEIVQSDMVITEKVY